ncbi:MAG: hypothetical protein WBY44_23225 [Bryobacteraceae bacterium]
MTRKAVITGSAAAKPMPLARAYRKPAAARTAQPIPKAARNPAGVCFIALILAFGLFVTARAAVSISTDDPPTNIAKLAAHRETETEAERNEYTYHQTVTLDELDSNGGIRGSYSEVRDIIFSPKHERTEQLIGKPRNGLKYLILTDEDFTDIRDIQPMVLTEDRLWNYQTVFKGEETVDEVDCWVLQVKPRQILTGQRLFDGMIWLDKKEYNVVRMEGQAVPQIRTMKSENLFPRFTTIRKPIDGKHWFPVYTYADDTLQFKSGPQRERLKIAYSDYKRFGAESTFTVK